LLTLAQWLTGATLLATVAAVIALVRARRITRRLERLSESYWELRYDHGQLEARVGKLEAGLSANPAPPPGVAARSGEPAGFIPLSSLKK
jgi:hypothetical protein